MTKPKIAVFGVLLLVLTTPACKPPPEATEHVRPVRTMRIGDAAVLLGRVFPGRAKATQEVDLAFRIGGPLIERPVDVGSVVEAGQTVARVDPRDFRVDLRNAEAQLEDAKATRALAIEEYDRAKDAHEKGAVSEIELARKLEARNSASAQVDSLEAAVNAAADALADTDLQAPFDGTVVATYVENFENVRAKQSIVRILDDSRIEMIVDIPESLIFYAPKLEEIWCTFAPFPDVEIGAEIKEIGTEASAITRTYPVTLIMDQPENVKILPGMTGHARGAVDVTADATAGEWEIPITAVASPEGATSYVWTIDEATSVAHRHEVKIVRVTARGVRVTGLEPGVVIATAGVHFLSEGQKVRPTDETLPGLSS